MAAQYASTPATANAALIDYTTREGISIFSKGIEPTDPLFDGQAENLRSFLDKVSD